MAKNFIQPGDVLDLTAPEGGVTSGGAYLINDLMVVALNSASAGQEFRGKVNGVWTLPKATGETWTAGSMLYLDDAEGEVTTDSSKGPVIGIAAAAAALADEIGNVRLNGAPALTLPGVATVEDATGIAVNSETATPVVTVAEFNAFLDALIAAGIAVEASS